MTVDSTHKDTKAEGEGETDSQLERGHKELLALFNAAIGAIRQNKEYQWKEFNASMLGQIGLIAFVVNQGQPEKFAPEAIGWLIVSISLTGVGLVAKSQFNLGRLRRLLDLYYTKFTLDCQEILRHEAADPMFRFLDPFIMIILLLLVGGFGYYLT